MKVIKFYSWKKDFFEFSNFSLHPIVVDGKTYFTNEHYFQAMKFLPTELITINGKTIPYSEYVRQAPTPREAKKRGSSRRFRIYPDWDTRRIEVMRTALRAKFTQHPKLADLLISTEDALLIEDSPTDFFWGGRITKDGKKGENMLGRLLMELREELKQQKEG